MKVLLVIILCYYKSFSYPIVKTWTFYELSKATQIKDPFVVLSGFNPNESPLVHAFGQMMHYLYNGDSTNVNALLLSPDGDKLWTKTQLKAALKDHSTDIYLIPFLGQAYVALNNKMSGKTIDEIDPKSAKTEVNVLALDISTWTKEDLKKALRDQSINPELVPYLKKAMFEFDEIYEEKTKNNKEVTIPRDIRKVTIITPVGLIPPPYGVIPRIIPKTVEESSPVQIFKIPKALNVKNFVINKLLNT